MKMSYLTSLNPQIFKNIAYIGSNGFISAEILKVGSAESTLLLFFAPAVLIFGLCTRTGCALVLIFGSICAQTVWAINTAVLSFGQLALCTLLIAQLCLVLGRYHSCANFWVVLSFWQLALCTVLIAQLCFVLGN